MDFTFPKQQRLKSKKIIDLIFEEGKSITVFPLKLIYLKTPLIEDVMVQVAVVAPKKRFKLAVKRNRIKRLMREAYRLNKALIFNNMEAQYALVFLYLGKEMPSFSQMEVGIKTLLTKFLKQISDEKTG
ncbi:MAG: ribonuclease P protein component [Bacteroidota bacterium]